MGTIHLSKLGDELMNKIMSVLFPHDASLSDMLSLDKSKVFLGILAHAATDLQIACADVAQETWEKIAERRLLQHVNKK